MNIVDMKTFLAVVEYHSTSLASKHMYASQPTISRRIKKLEQELGSQLFVNTTYGVELTQKGKAFLPYIRQILGIYNEMMKAEHNDRKSRPKLTINVGLNPYVSLSVFAEFINYMLALKTNYFIINKIIPGKDLNTSLSGGNYDLFILPYTGNCPANITSIPLWKERVLPVVSITHPLAKRNTPISITELAEYDAVLTTNDSILRQKFNVLVAQKGISPKIIAEVNTVYNCIQTVEHGQSWCLIYERLLDDKLAVVELSDFTIDIEFHAFYLKKRSEERLIWEFVEYLRQWLSQSSDLSDLLIKTKSLSIQGQDHSNK
ncbi:LysR family transcriptional regulator [Legionella cincinnatiensis]|uniref:LysR family transcriptional regulator n=1 Tax=Legionella cincinnatiensis TaxID=28085 RepID=A0A378IMV0_9GAMM|nr:LysR family transcriptional regulator [Legionella cincinnatiensis]KTC85273.1 LysR family transcriptional regulator [Legionella cincinnatiensis]STX36363.1 LysR family transcriptional regulator [Legionella cincinnatiensis]